MEKSRNRNEARSDSSPVGLTRDELFDLRKHYEGVVREELGLSHQYFNFYIGLLSAIQAATLAGLLQMGSGDLRGLFLLLGPLVAIYLAKIGYSTVAVFQRRFIEAWVTVFNIDSMLDITNLSSLGEGISRPRFASRYGGFVPQWPAGRDAVEELTPSATAEDAREMMIEKHTITLDDARRTFQAFAVVSAFLFVGTLLFVSVS